MEEEVKPKKPIKKKEKEVKKQYHIIEDGETRWSLMKKYGVTAEELDKLNPNFNGRWLSLKKGYSIRIK